MNLLQLPSEILSLLPLYIDNIETFTNDMLATAREL